MPVALLFALLFLATPQAPKTIDLAADAERRVVVDREAGQHIGHPTTVLLGDGRTLLAAYPKGHGRGAIVLRRSRDGGRSWGERLPVPASFATSLETPTLHRVSGPDGKERLLLFSGLHPVRLSTSEDEGETWSELAPVGTWGGIVAMASLEVRASGELAAYFHDDGRFLRGAGKAEGTFTLLETRSQDGGRTWSEPRALRVRLANDLEGSDCGYAGLECLPDGTFVAVSYGHWTKGEVP